MNIEERSQEVLKRAQRFRPVMSLPDVREACNIIRALAELVAELAARAEQKH